MSQQNETLSSHQCKVPPFTGHCQDGEQWTCECGVIYEHVCDEAEGCYWESIGVVEAE